MRVLGRGAQLVVLAAALGGCTAEVGPEEDAVGVAEGAIVKQNALNVNALNVNALNVNALNVNALNVNALDPNSFAAIRNPGANGDLAREFVKYAVSCSFHAGQTFEFTWIDEQNVEHAEAYPGVLGLAPDWRAGPLDLAGQRMVSACLAGLTNYYGTHVTISMRAPEAPLKVVDPNELLSYPNIEGAFWGNLWDEEGSYLHSCYNSAMVAYSRTHSRDCAAGHLNPDNSVVECGIIDIVGPCDTVCEPVNDETGAFPSCIRKPDQDPAVTEHIITTALP
ncbi:hypothetical protein [Polyangium mundeleinium]|uniref:Lipoprotein n=1 Tax=Polyangium mundeleinium TaxID=2995306 RepID=A0ABT5EHF5_9BACT|nr:hypothetical protein [Polyangium mundeleinium]MDC0741260.1 hypothetical protein [Polyangium mundeleinium]